MQFLGLAVDQAVYWLRTATKADFGLLDKKSHDLQGMAFSKGYGFLPMFGKSDF